MLGFKHFIPLFVKKGRTGTLKFLGSWSKWLRLEISL